MKASMEPNSINTPIPSQPRCHPRLQKSITTRGSLPRLSANPSDRIAKLYQAALSDPPLKSECHWPTTMAPTVPKDNHDPRTPTTPQTRTHRVEPQNSIKAHQPTLPTRKLENSRPWKRLNLRRKPRATQPPRKPTTHHQSTAPSPLCRPDLPKKQNSL